jgi:inosine-uridine nucleoside N-ribohydrolase
MKLPVWIDCDPGVDDAAGLLLAHALPELEIVGISTVAGNVPLSVTTANALKLGDFMGAPYPVYAGAKGPMLRPYVHGADFHGADGFCGASLPESSRQAESQTAWAGLYAAAKAHAGRLELVTMGPLTNIAIALQVYPDLPQYLHRIVMMGGSATRGNRTPCAEYNIYADPEAAQAVFRSGVPIVMCGLEVTEQAYFTPEEWDELGSVPTEKARFLHRAGLHILEKNLQTGQKGFCIHDACPVFYLAHPEAFQGEEAGVFVETQGSITLGKTVTDLFSDRQFETKNALVLLQIDRQSFRQAILNALQ